LVNANLTGFHRFYAKKIRQRKGRLMYGRG